MCLFDLKPGNQITLYSSVQKRKCVRMSGFTENCTRKSTGRRIYPLGPSSSFLSFFFRYVGVWGRFFSGCTHTSRSLLSIYVLCVYIFIMRRPPINISAYQQQLYARFFLSAGAERAVRVHHGEARAMAWSFI